MELREIKEFLKSKKGYLKEGGKRLRNHLRNKGFETTIKNCKEALRQCRAEEKGYDIKFSNDTARVLIYDIETSPNIGWFWRAGYKLNIPASSRASVGIYNTKDDLDKLNEAINNCKKIFSHTIFRYILNNKIISYQKLYDRAYSLSSFFLSSSDKSDISIVTVNAFCMASELFSISKTPSFSTIFKVAFSYKVFGGK